MTNRKPFVRYRMRGGVRVVPQTATGWMIFATFMMIVLLPVILQAWIATRWSGFMTVYLFAAPAIIITFVIIAWRNADVIDLRVTGEDLADFRAWQEQRRTRKGRD